jgi:mannose-1-phosphate guanylyltransferase
LEDVQAIPNVSLDYAVMEKSERIKVVPCDLGWSDLGSFDALYDESLGVSEKENAVMAEDTILINSKRCLVIGKEKPIILDGVEDLIVVQTEDATLIMRRGQSQDVRQVLKIIEHDRPDLL